MAGISDRLRLVIGDKSVNQWADDHDLPRQTVHEWIKHDRTPRGSSMKALVNATGISEDWWLHGEGPPPATVSEARAAHAAAFKGTVDVDLLGRVLAILEESLRKFGIVDLPPKKKAELAAFIYEDFVRSGRIEPKHLERLIRLVR